MSVSPHPGGGSGAGVAPSPHPTHDDRDPPAPRARTPQAPAPPGGTPSSGGQGVRIPLDKLTSAAQAMESKGGAIRETANRYQKVDEEAQQAFQRFLDTMGGGQ